MEEALNPDGSINTDVLGEVISIAVEHYFMTPGVIKCKRFLIQSFGAAA